jgi:hypothetical protein
VKCNLLPPHFFANGVSDEFVEEVEDEDDLVVRDFGLTLGLDGHGGALAIRVKIEGSLTESTTNTLAAKLPPNFRRGVRVR